MILLTRIANLASGSGGRLMIAFKSGGNFPRISTSESEATLLSIAGLCGWGGALAIGTGVPAGTALGSRPYPKIRFRNSINCIENFPS